MPRVLETLLGVSLLAAMAPVAAETLGQLRGAYAPPNTTVLVRDGAADFVVAVAGGYYQYLAREVVRAILGRDDPARVIEADAQPPLDRTHVITLGCLAENPLLFRLYWNKYTLVDLVTPGPKQGRVEVICDPYPWCAGKNLIVLGGSDETGVRAALEHFRSRLQKAGDQCSYPWEVFVSNPPTVKPEDVKLDTDPTFQTFNNLAAAYLSTTAEPYAEKAFAALDAIRELYQTGRRSGFTYAEECTSPATFYLWDGIEHHPSLTPERHERYADLLYSVLLLGLPSHTYEWNDLAAGPKLVWNHTGCPLFGIYVGARYFDKHYPDTHGFTADALRRSANAFLTQMEVWKPREDAHSYYQLGFRTVMDYCAGEWNLAYIENGSLKQMADYAIATADNMGGAANFGDAEAIHSNATELSILDTAFAWLKDPGYLWRLNVISGGTWQNRYHRGVKPEPPLRLSGIKLIPMARTIYDLHNGHEPYGDATLPPSEVPVERSFDKISLRDGIDPLGQYLLLDGFSSGMHLHYDANMIVRFADRGRVWLMDDDYLVRQSTDHTGVSLLRNSRNTERMPVFASADGVMDGLRVGLLLTSLPGYNGADWKRGLIWRKGRYLLLVDEVRPRDQADQLQAFNILKLYDTGAVRFSDAGALLSTQPADGPEHPEATFTVLPAEEVSASLARRRSASSDIPSARLIERVTTGGKPVTFRNLLSVSDALKTVELDQRSLNEGYVAIRGRLTEKSILPALTQGKPYSFEPAPSDTYADTEARVLADGYRPSADNIKAGWVAWYVTSPTITVDLQGEQRLSTVAVQVMGGNQWGIRFPTRVTLELAGADGQFQAAGEYRPTWPELGNRYAQDVVFGGLNRSARQIRLKLECAPGGFVFVGEVWATGKETMADRGAEALAAIAGRGKLALPGLSLDADLTYVAPDEVCLLGARACGIGGTKLAVSGNVQIRLAGRPDGKRLSAAVAQAINDAFAKGKPGRFLATAPLVGETVPCYRFAGGEGIQIRPLPDDEGGFVGANGRSVWRVDRALKEVWRRDLPAVVSGVGAGDLDQDGGLEFFAGTVGEMLYCLDDQGQDRWQWEVQPKVLEWAGWNGKAWAEQIRVADINGDGRNELLLGTKNSWLLALNQQRETLWRYGLVYHGCRDLQVVDLDGDGNPEVLAANRYGTVTRHDGRTGKVLAAYGTELGDTFVVVAPKAVQGWPVVFSGCTTGKFRGFDLGGQVLWSFDNEGFGALAAAVTDAEVWLASEGGLLYCLRRQDGSSVFARDLGSAAVSVVPRDKGVVACDERGGVWQVDVAGQARQIACLGSRPLQLVSDQDGLFMLTAEALWHVPVP